MARPANKRIFTEKMTFEAYYALLAKIEQKRAILAKKRHPTVTLSQNLLSNIEAIIIILMATGLRISEVRFITVGDIRKAIINHAFVVYEPKKNQYRRVVIGRATAEIFKKVFNEKLNEISNNNLIIRKHKNIQSPFSKDYLQQMINKFTKEVLGEGFTSHSFRRFAITEVLNRAGENEAKVLANHSKIETTLLYKRFNEEEILKSVLDGVWKNQT